MLINCFRPRDSNDGNDDRPQPARRPATAKRASTFLRRSGTDNSQVSSTSSTISNDSISKLPPCIRTSDPKIEAMMMPVPIEGRPSRCLRLSHPRMYSSLIFDMKQSRGCRTWKDFDVFYADDVDMNVSAVEQARKRAADHEKKWKQLSSFDSDEPRRSIDDVDLIG